MLTAAEARWENEGGALEGERPSDLAPRGPSDRRGAKATARRSARILRMGTSTCPISQDPPRFTVAAAIRELGTAKIRTPGKRRSAGLDAKVQERFEGFVPETFSEFDMDLDTPAPRDVVKSEVQAHLMQVLCRP